MKYMGPFQILPDEDLAMGFRQALVPQSHKRSQVKDVSERNKTLNKHWVLPHISKLVSSSSRTPNSPSPDNFAVSGKKTNHDLCHCCDGLILNRSLIQEDAQIGNYNSLSLGTIPFPTP